MLSDSKLIVPVVCNISRIFAQRIRIVLDKERFLKAKAAFLQEKTGNRVELRASQKHFFIKNMKKGLKFLRENEYFVPMNLKRFIFLLVFILPFAFATAQSKKDPVEVDAINFKNLQKTEVAGAGGPLVRCEVVLLPRFDKEDPKAKWIRNIEVDIMVAYKNTKAKASSKSKFVFLHSRAKIFAGKVNSKTPVVFFVPWEAYDVYGLKGEPAFYKVSLFVNGSEVPLTAANLSSRVSKEITSQEILDKFETEINNASSLNDGVLRPLNECSVNIQNYEFNKSQFSVPTYLNVK